MTLNYYFLCELVKKLKNMKHKDDFKTLLYLPKVQIVDVLDKILYCLLYELNLPVMDIVPFCIAVV
jgi:hypothetical protein